LQHVYLLFAVALLLVDFFVLADEPFEFFFPLPPSFAEGFSLLFPFDDPDSLGFTDRSEEFSFFFTGGLGLFADESLSEVALRLGLVSSLEDLTEELSFCSSDDAPYSA